MRIIYFKKNKTILRFHEYVVLIIEDSESIRITLSQYIKKMGFTKIEEAVTGKRGIEKFIELTEIGITPLVFLGYHLPDMSAAEIVPIMLSKSPEAKLVLETSKDRNEESVRHLFSLGVSHFIAKPLRFENMKDVINTIKEEFELQTNISVETELVKIRDHLKAVRKTSMCRLMQNFNFSEEKMSQCLQELRKEGDVLEMKPIKEMLCNKCNSVNTSIIFACPNCKRYNFSQTKLIEHYDCGAIHPDYMFENDKCPQCKKYIKALGVDHRTISNLFTCKECNEKFPNPTIDLNCIKCENKFSFFEAIWIDSPIIMWINESEKQHNEIEEITVLK